jgi:hypothetical protein
VGISQEQMMELIKGLAQEREKSRDMPIHPRRMYRYFMDRPAKTERQVARERLAKYPGPFNMSVCFELTAPEIVLYIYASIIVDIEAVKKALPDEIGDNPPPVRSINGSSGDTLSCLGVFEHA